MGSFFNEKSKIEIANSKNDIARKIDGLDVKVSLNSANISQLNPKIGNSATSESNDGKGINEDKNFLKANEIKKNNFVVPKILKQQDDSSLKKNVDLHEEFNGINNSFSSINVDGKAERESFESIDNKILKIKDRVDEKNKVALVEKSKVGVVAAVKEKPISSITTNVQKIEQKEQKSQPQKQLIDPNSIQKDTATTTIKANNGEENPYSQIIDDASGVDAEMFNGRYPKYNKDKYYKLDPFAKNNDLFSLVASRHDIESLDISNCNFIYDFSPIARLKHLKEFSAHNCKTMENVDFLTGLTGIEVLNLSCTSVVDLSGLLSRLPKLKILNVAATKITSLTGLRNCKELIELTLWGCFGISDLNELEFLYKLRLLDIDSTNISDLFPLVNSKKLEFLYADNCSGIREFAPFEALSRSLRVLFLDGSTIIPMGQLEHLASLENLEILSLKFRKVSSGHIFKNMKKMKNLNLDGSFFADLSPLGGLVELKSLDLTGNSAIRDVSCLSKLVNLKKLLIGGGGAAFMKNTKTGAGVSTSSQMLIEDFSVISNFVNLEEIHIDNNPKVRSIAGIKNCVNMEEVYMEKCTQMEDIYELAYLKKLRVINLNFCPKIKDMYFLQYLANLGDVQFDGTIADSVAFLTQFKKSAGVYILKSYGNDLLTQNVTRSTKKRVKMLKFMKKNLKLLEEIE